MKKINGSWAVKIDTDISIDKIHPVIDYLNKMYGKSYGNLKNKGSFYYGVNYSNNSLCSLSKYNYSKILTEQEFLNLTQEMTKEEIENYKDFKKGDILINNGYFSKVVETLGDIVFRTHSTKNLNEVYTQALNIYSATTKENVFFFEGWRLYVYEKKSPTVELTLEDIAKKFNIDIANLKIKNDSRN